MSNYMNNDKEFDDMIAALKEFNDALRALDEKIKEVTYSQQEVIERMKNFIKILKNE